MPKIKTLRKCPIFRELSFRDLAILAPFVREESAKSNSWISEEGKPTNGLIVIREGRVRISATLADGADIEIGPGEFFGEMSIVDGDQKRAVGAKAISACDYLRVPPTDYHQLMTRAPDVAAKVAQGVLETMTEKLELTRQLLVELVSTRLP